MNAYNGNAMRYFTRLLEACHANVAQYSVCLHPQRIKPSLIQPNVTGRICRPDQLFCALSSHAIPTPASGSARSASTATFRNDELGVDGLEGAAVCPTSPFRSRARRGRPDAQRAELRRAERAKPPARQRRLQRRRCVEGLREICVEFRDAPGASKAVR
jgi:hypothetical protein